jgi:hypothetical protein
MKEGTQNTSIINGKAKITSVEFDLYSLRITVQKYFFSKNYSQLFFICGYFIILHHKILRPWTH